MKALFLAFLSALLLAACGGGSDPSSPPNGPVSVSISPNAATVNLGSTKQFTANVVGTSNTAVSWSISGSGCTGGECGNIDANGLYTAPSVKPTPATVVVKAILRADPSKSAIAAVTVSDGSIFGPPAITTTSLPNGSVGMAYDARVRASGGIPPYGWGITEGSLPPGLALTGTGTPGSLDIAIAGTPTTAGTYDFIITVFADTSPPETGSAALRIVIN